MLKAELRSTNKTCVFFTVLQTLENEIGDTVHSNVSAFLVSIGKLERIQQWVYIGETKYFSKHFTTIEVKNVGLKSLFSDGQAFLGTGVMTPFSRGSG